MFPTFRHLTAQTAMKYNELVLALDTVGVQDSVTEAHIILEELFGISRAQILLDRERDYDSSKIESVIEQRRNKIPLQHIIGKWYFMGEQFAVSPDCLIPRPDTEILVCEAVKLLKRGGCVADLCTGSGCIGISMLKQRPDIEKMILADISEKALDIARANANALQVSQSCDFELCDITKQIPGGKYDMIVSNPPYIPSADVSELSEEVKKEPFLALDGGEDGLDVINALIRLAPKHLNEGAYLLIEHGYDQGKEISAIMDEMIASGTYKNYRILKDYGGNDRVLVAQR